MIKPYNLTKAISLSYQKHTAANLDLPPVICLSIDVEQDQSTLLVMTHRCSGWHDIYKMA